MCFNDASANMDDAESRYIGTMNILQLQLTQSQSLNIKFSKSLNSMMEIFHRVTGFNAALQAKNADIQSSADQLSANNCILFSKFEQLQITNDNVAASSLHSSTEDEQIKALVDTLASSSVSYEQFIKSRPHWTHWQTLACHVTLSSNSYSHQSAMIW